ncbi:hypothetical protein [Actinomadura rupiterrae]|uniref:hypothetical protein n=1 Tax=Actinomadura rupiterrae TaxID=559627 RepID=UPI0020A5AA47|nr:hypothetical protein [Actinomadura rupiterrae]MCP2343389.1 hypothetical protein [Actinomadura rupiterrae]
MAAKNTAQVATIEESSWERVKAAQASKLMTLAPPWLVWPFTAGIGQMCHVLWGHGQAAAWSGIGLTLGTGLLSAVTWNVSHQRGILGRGSATATTAAAGMWVTACSVAGIGQPVVTWLVTVGGLVGCLGWNIRTVIREKQGLSGVMDPLAFLFDHAKDKTGLDGARMATVKASEHKIEAAMALPAGQKTVADIQKKTEHIEGAMALPPGTITVSADEDRADRAKVVLSDARVMKHPIPWPGPYRPGGSIGEPLRIGVWQDGDEVLHTIAGHHFQVMGKTGAGKSVGAAWNYLAEIITRRDVVVFAADLTKGEQSIGKLRPALHRFETTTAGVRSLINDIHAQLKPRTDWLSAHGYVNWEPGCGLTYWVLWLEEVPDIFDALGDKGVETFLKLLKAIRSAGGTIVLSLQRSDWTQMPTIARGQLANMCFGVANAADAAFGLSDAQEDAGARPELWGDKQPGMAYLDAPSIDSGRIAMPLRTFGWLKSDGKPDPAALHAHALEWPAAAKQVDEFTAAVTRAAAAVMPLTGPVGAASGTDDANAPDDRDDAVSGPQDDGDDWNPEDDITTPDPDPSITADKDGPIEDDPDDAEWTFTRPTPTMTAAQARQTLYDRIAQWQNQGVTDFTTADLSDIWTNAGLSRAWAQKWIRKLRDDGVLGFDDETQRHQIHAAPDTAGAAA